MDHPSIAVPRLRLRRRGNSTKLGRPAGSSSGTGRHQEAAMTTMFRYAIPVAETGWSVDSSTETRFTWEYEDGRDKLLSLYDKGKKQQWDAAERIDWSADLDTDNPMGLDDRTVQIYGSDIWNRLTESEKGRVRHHLQAASLSPFIQGEPGAVMSTS